MHEVRDWEPKLHPTSSFLSNRWPHWPHTCRVEAGWVLGLKPSALLAPTACSKYACTLWGTSGHRHLNQWLLWSFSELQTHVDNLLLERTFWTAQTQSETNALSSLCLLYFWTLPLSNQHPGLHSETSRIFQDSPWSSPYRISGIYHQICWFASSLLPKSESTPHHHHLKFKLPSQPITPATLPPTSMGLFSQSACHLAGRVSFQIVNLILPAPVFKYLTSFSLPLQLRRQIPEGPARPVVCLPLLLYPLHQLRGGGWLPALECVVCS